MTSPRVAILGLMLESNRWSRPAGSDDFERSWLEGQAILDEARETNTAMAMEAAAFVKAMDATGLGEQLAHCLANGYRGGQR